MDHSSRITTGTLWTDYCQFQLQFVITTYFLRGKVRGGYLFIWSTPIMVYLKKTVIETKQKKVEKSIETSQYENTKQTFSGVLCNFAVVLSRCGRHSILMVSQTLVLASLFLALAGVTELQCCGSGQDSLTLTASTSLHPCTCTTGYPQTQCWG